jgi:hypothetical protein
VLVADESLIAAFPSLWTRALCRFLHQLRTSPVDFDTKGPSKSPGRRLHDTFSCQHPFAATADGVVAGFRRDGALERVTHHAGPIDESAELLSRMHRKPLTRVPGRSSRRSLVDGFPAGHDS